MSKNKDSKVRTDPRGPGATENARNDIVRPSKLHGMTTREHSGLMVMINSDYTLLLSLLLVYYYLIFFNLV